MNHPAIPSIRAEYMPVSSFLIQYVLEISNCSKIFRSAFALKEGLIQNVLLNKEMYIE